MSILISHNLASSLNTNLILFPLKTKNFNTFPLTLDVKYKIHQLILDRKVYSVFCLMIIIYY